MREPAETEINGLVYTYIENGDKAMIKSFPMIDSGNNWTICLTFEYKILTEGPAMFMIKNTQDDTDQFAGHLWHQSYQQVSSLLV